MRSIFKKIVLAVLVCTMLSCALVGCSSKGKTLMELEGEDISVNSVMLLMSRMKGSLASASAFGAKALQSSFWDTVTDAESKQTYDKYYTNLVVDSAKTYLAALAYFDELGLKLPDSTIDEIDEEMKTLVDSDGDGSKSALNAILADYGANYKILRDSYIMEAKLAYLSDHLFGADGSLIADTIYEDYYKQNYVRFRQIFFFTQKPVYEKDARGDVIYYSDLQEKTVAYNSKAEGVYRSDLKDKNGDFIWLYKDKDGVERISYDKDGEKSPVVDSKGKVQTEKLTADEMVELTDTVQIIMEEKVKECEYALFDSLVDKYGEDEGMEQYPNGYYMTASSEYDAPEVIKALFEMKDGEIREISSDYGIHIVMKYPLETGGYAKEENKDFFRTENGTYGFLGTLKNQLLEAYVADYKAKIEIDEELLDTLSMKNIGANYHY